MMKNNSLIEFPCNFPIKIIGVNTSEFLNEITSIIFNHFPDLDSSALTHKSSQQSNYLAITVTVIAKNQSMLDAFYIEINQHPDVKMVL